ncbi:MAG: hypothetical protein ACFFCS_27495, partial [Candidatus Hodarchaeota archaeon]
SIKTIDHELIELMKRSGCTSVCLAIESGSEYIRNEVYRKGLSTKKIFEVFNWFNKIFLYQPFIGLFDSKSHDICINIRVQETFYLFKLLASFSINFNAPNCIIESFFCHVLSMTI